MLDWVFSLDVGQLDAGAELLFTRLASLALGSADSVTRGGLHDCNRACVRVAVEFAHVENDVASCVVLDLAERGEVDELIRALLGLLLVLEEHDDAQVLPRAPHDEHHVFAELLEELDVLRVG